MINYKKSMVKKKENQETFGERLVRTRKIAGLTQTELGNRIGVTKRVICYYERATKRPPAAKLHLIAEALKVTTDELLGVKKIENNVLTKNAKLVKRLKLIDHLPPADQNALIHYIDLLLAKQKIKKKPNESMPVQYLKAAEK